jgi:hypothetical protein
MRAVYWESGRIDTDAAPFLLFSLLHTVMAVSAESLAIRSRKRQFWVCPHWLDVVNMLGRGNATHLPAVATQRLFIENLRS